MSTPRALPKHFFILIGLAGLVMLVASACGGGSESAAPEPAPTTDAPTAVPPTVEPPTPEPPPATPEPTVAPTATETPTPAPTPLPQCQRFEEEHGAAVQAAVATEPTLLPEDPLEREWAEDRAAAVQRIVDGDYGVRDCVLHGPGGLELDLRDCPEYWSDYAGISDESVSLVSIAPATGNFAAFDEIGEGMGAVFAQTNNNGGVGSTGTQIVLDRIDDRLDADEARRIVEEAGFTDGQGPFALSVTGTLSLLTVQAQLNNECVPHPFNSTGHPSLSDSQLPWGSALQMGWDVEALLWVDWIEENLAEQAPVAVGLVVADNDFGLAYSDPFLAAAEVSAVIGEIRIESHEPAATDVSEEISELGEVDVLIGMTAGAACSALPTAAYESGLSAQTSVNFLPSVCVVRPGADVGRDRWLSMVGVRTAASSTDPSVGELWVDRVLASAGLTTAQTPRQRQGVALAGWTWVQTMEIAHQLPGGLSRTNLLLAMHSLDLKPPGMLRELRIQTDGLTDQHPIESSLLGRVTGANNIEWIEDRSIEGQTPGCSWLPRNGCM